MKVNQQSLNKALHSLFHLSTSVVARMGPYGLVSAPDLILRAMGRSLTQCCARYLETYNAVLLCPHGPVRRGIILFS